jgi:phosphoadenosine phosphosulfate reductase
MGSDIPILAINASAGEIFAAGITAAGGPVSVACSFSKEDIAVIDIGVRAGLSFGVFALDTGRLDEETYEVADAVISRYGLKIDWYFPDRHAVERLERDKGLHSFRESLENRHECCAIRKVEPLGRALSGLSGWVTGLRREQSVTRSDVGAIERDESHGGIIKINPIISWTEKELDEYTERERLPVNRLYHRGYRSIGCEPCTRAVQEGESVRSGRWWWEDPEHKECGLHRK